MTNVVNPSPVPIRLRSATAGAYLALNRALREAADQAERVAAAFATPDGPTADLTAAQQQGAADWRAVRDALRNAATEALVPRGGTGRPRCRRCSIDCPYCSPPAAAEPERDGMSHLYDCCPAGPTEAHTPECERNS